MRESVWGYAYVCVCVCVRKRKCRKKKREQEQWRTCDGIGRETEREKDRGSEKSVCWGENVREKQIGRAQERKLLSAIDRKRDRYRWRVKA